MLEFAKVHHDRGLIECRIVESHWLEPRHQRGPPVRNRVPKTIWADKLVLCNGRVPNTKKLNLDAAGVEVDSQGGILVDALNRSVSARHVCAAGDVTGGGRAGGLTAIAEMQSRWAIEKLMSPDGPYVRPVYRGVSAVLQVTPEMAFVGMSEAEAQRRQLPHVAAKVRRATCAFDRSVGVDCGVPLGQPSCLRVWSRWWVVGGGLQVGGCWWRHVWARADRFTSSTPPSSNTSIPLPRPPLPARW